MRPHLSLSLALALVVALVGCDATAPVGSAADASPVGNENAESDKAAFVWNPSEPDGIGCGWGTYGIFSDRGTRVLTSAGVLSYTCRDSGLDRDEMLVVEGFACTFPDSRTTFDSFLRITKSGEAVLRCLYRP